MRFWRKLLTLIAAVIAILLVIIFAAAVKGGRLTAWSDSAPAWVSALTLAAALAIIYGVFVKSSAATWLRSRKREQLANPAMTSKVDEELVQSVMKRHGLTREAAIKTLDEFGH